MRGKTGVERHVVLPGRGKDAPLAERGANEQPRRRQGRRSFGRDSNGAEPVKLALRTNKDFIARRHPHMGPMSDNETRLRQREKVPEHGFFDHRVFFHNAKGEESSPMECVVPIGLFDPEIELFHPIATGVFISTLGLVCTARHAFIFERQFMEAMSHLSDRSYPAIYQYMPDHTFYIRPIATVHGHPKFDLAVAVCEPLNHLATGEPFENMMQALTTDHFPIGTKVHQYSYPEPILHQHEGRLQVLMIPLSTAGTIIDWLPEGMGRLFPSPVYVIEGYIGAGSSGGPIMDDTGRVIAISSRGCEAENYYYGIPVRCIADIKMESVVLSSPPEIRGPTIREMAARGFLSFVRPKDEDE
jgi:hypothetical protein